MSTVSNNLPPINENNQPKGSEIKEKSTSEVTSTNNITSKRILIGSARRALPEGVREKITTQETNNDSLEGHFVTNRKHLSEVLEKSRKEVDSLSKKIDSVSVGRLSSKVEEGGGLPIYNENGELQTFNSEESLQPGSHDSENPPILENSVSNLRPTPPSPHSAELSLDEELPTPYPEEQPPLPAPIQNNINPTPPTPEISQIQNVSKDISPDKSAQLEMKDEMDKIKKNYEASLRKKLTDEGKNPEEIKRIVDESLSALKFDIESIIPQNDQEKISVKYSAAKPPSKLISCNVEVKWKITAKIGNEPLLNEANEPYQCELKATIYTSSSDPHKAVQLAMGFMDICVNIATGVNVPTNVKGEDSKNLMNERSWTMIPQREGDRIVGYNSGRPSFDSAKNLITMRSNSANQRFFMEGGNLISRRSSTAENAANGGHKSIESAFDPSRIEIDITEIGENDLKNFIKDTRQTFEENKKQFSATNAFADKGVIAKIRGQPSLIEATVQLKKEIVEGETAQDSFNQEVARLNSSEEQLKALEERINGTPEGANVELEPDEKALLQLGEEADLKRESLQETIKNRITEKQAEIKSFKESNHDASTLLKTKKNEYEANEKALRTSLIQMNEMMQHLIAVQNAYQVRTQKTPFKKEIDQLRKDYDKYKGIFDKEIGEINPEHKVSLDPPSES